MPSGADIELLQGYCVNDIAVDMLAQCMVTPSTAMTLALYDNRVVIILSVGFQLSAASKHWVLMANTNISRFFLEQLLVNAKPQHMKVQIVPCIWLPDL